MRQCQRGTRTGLSFTAVTKSGNPVATSVPSRGYDNEREIETVGTRKQQTPGIRQRHAREKTMKRNKGRTLHAALICCAVLAATIGATESATAQTPTASVSPETGFGSESGGTRKVFVYRVIRQ